MGFNFSREGAMKAGTSDHITESGVYIGKLTKAVETNHDSGAVSIEFEFESNEGQKAKYLRLFTVKKDKTDAYGINHVYALMGILKLAKADPVQIDPEHQGYPMFCNKPIGIILQRENKADGKFGMNILHFIDPVTKKTCTEHFNNEEAKEYKKEIKDKNSAQNSGNANSGANQNHSNNQTSFDSMFGPSNDDCPF